MINPYRTLTEGLPERAPPRPGALPSEVRALQSWADGLPRANQKAYLQELLGALDDFQSRRMEGQERMEAMEVLRPLLLEAGTFLAIRLRGSTFPLTGVHAEAAEQLLALHRGLAVQYRLAVIEACAPAGKVPLLRRGQVAVTLLRAMLHHVRWLSTSHFLYRAPEAGNWAQLYALSSFAALRGLDDRAIADPAEGRKLTVRLLLNQAVMLALANPYRFNQRELGDLWTLTRDLAGLVRLTPERFAAAAAVALIDVDQPPTFVARAPDPEQGDLLWVDAQRICETLEASISHAGTSSEAILRLSRDHTLMLPTHLLKRVQESWSQDVSRSHPRLPGGYEIESVIGLSGLHYHLAGEQDFESFMRQARGVSMLDGERATWAHGSDSGHPETVPVEVLDQSLGGYRLRWHGRHGVRAKIGELVGLATGALDAPNRDWTVGIVRWLRYDAAGDMDVGIDLLARRARAASVRALDVAGSTQAPVRALHLSGVGRPAAELAEHDDQAEAMPAAAEIVLVSALTGPETPQLEMVRAADRWDFSEDTGAQIYPMVRQPEMRRAGDYMVLKLQRL